MMGYFQLELFFGLFNVIQPLITSRSSTSPPGTGLVHRCVIVQKDQLGFGFTVCGERVKLVQNVRPGEKGMLRLLCHRNVDGVKGERRYSDINFWILKAQ